MRTIVVAVTTVMIASVGCSSADRSTEVEQPTQDAGQIQEPTGPDLHPDAGQDVSPTDSGQACRSAGDLCTGYPQACCNGATCVYDVANPGRSICATNCLRGSQCNSGCCTVLIEGSSAVCAPANYCAGSCVQPGGLCAGATCCPNSVCVDSTVDGTRCAARCIAHSQCNSGCCAPLDNTGELVCSPRNFCL